jgi:hypothetical protein
MEPQKRKMRRLYEPRNKPPLSMRKFIVRMAVHACYAIIVITASLFAGMLGYSRFEQMPWLDAFLNASMLLGGMGPIKTEGMSEAGKLFAGLYALYSGLVFIAVMGIMLAPVIHRVLHLFHWEDEGEPG